MDRQAGAGGSTRNGIPGGGKGRRRVAAGLDKERVGEALGEWQAAELRLARRFAQCRGLGTAQLEDLYQETVLALLPRHYENEEHLRHALRFGLKNRALHLHRDERRRAEILAEHAPEAHRSALGRAEPTQPEPATLAGFDQLVVLEFISELTRLEQKIFGLEAEGLRYRAIAPMLGVSVNEARKASRCAQKKRERFQLLHDTGRLCGYRAPTILALKAGEATSEQLARQAFAHLEGCTHCREEHGTNARRLRDTFQGRAAALLPVPALAGRLGWLGKLDLRARTLSHRLPTLGPSTGLGDAREGAIAALAGGGAAAKIAAGAASVAVLAGGTIGATHSLQSAHLGPPRGDRGQSARASRENTARSVAVHDSAPAAQSTRVPRSNTTSPQSNTESRPREPGGFSYLGVPHNGASDSGSQRASAASVSTPQPNLTDTGTVSRAPVNTEGQTRGGPFSP